MSVRHVVISAFGAFAAAQGTEDTCLIGQPSNCQGDVSSHLAEASKPHSCVRFTDLPGDCTLTFSASTKADCLLPFSRDLAVSVSRNGKDEEHITTGDSPQLQWTLPVGYNELVLRNNHRDWPSSCEVDLPDISYCCVPRTPKPVEDTPLVQGRGGESATKAQLRARLGIAEKTEGRLVGESQQVQEELHATNSQLRGTRHTLVSVMADLDFYQTMAAVLLWAVVLFLACYYLMPEFRRLLLRGQQRLSVQRAGLLAPLIEEKAVPGEQPEPATEAAPTKEPTTSMQQDEAVSSFDPPVAVVDYVNDLGEEIRCVRVEVPGRRMADGARSVSGSVSVEALEGLCGTRVQLRFSKEDDMPCGAASVSARKGSEGDWSTTTASDGGRPRSDSKGSSLACEGVWEKTLTFEDGFWQPATDTSDSGELDKHGVWQLQLVRTSMLQSYTLSVPASSSAPGCECYDIAGESVCNSSEAEWLAEGVVQDLQSQEQLESPSSRHDHHHHHHPEGAPSESCDGASSFDKCSEVSVPVFGLEEDCGHSMAGSETGPGR